MITVYMHTTTKLDSYLASALLAAMMHDGRSLRDHVNGFMMFVSS